MLAMWLLVAAHASSAAKRVGGPRMSEQATNFLPPSSDALELARSIYELKSPPQLVLFATGGGAQTPAFLLSIPGASRSVLEVQVPYAKASLTQLLGAEPARYCSADVARNLASAAFERARLLQQPGVSTHTIGLGCTAALRAEPLRRGAHRAFVAVHTTEGVHELSLVLAKGARSRALEDAVVSRMALAALAHACGVAVPKQSGGADFWRLASDQNGSARVDREQMAHKFTPHSTPSGGVGLGG